MTSTLSARGRIYDNITEMTGGTPLRERPHRRLDD